MSSRTIGRVNDARRLLRSEIHEQLLDLLERYGPQRRESSAARMRRSGV